MHNIFGGPFDDSATVDAFRSIEDAPHLIIDTQEQKRHYATKLLDILKNHGKYTVFQVGPTTIKSRGSKIDLMNVLYPSESPRFFTHSDLDKQAHEKKIFVF